MAEFRKTEYGPWDGVSNTPNPILWECVVTRRVDGTPNCHHKELQPDGTFKQYDHVPKDDKLRALRDREREAALALKQAALATKLGVSLTDLRDVLRSLV